MDPEVEARLESIEETIEGMESDINRISHTLRILISKLNNERD